MNFSFVYAARNDRYCGDAPMRLSLSLHTLLAHLARFETLRDTCEIIVVDWNSEGAPLHEHVYFTDQNIKGVRFVVVPPHVAQTYRSTSPVSEVHAYNTGARFARGKYILRMDQDILVGVRFLQYLATLLDEGVVLDRMSPVWCSRRETHPVMYKSIVDNPVAFVSLHGHTLPLWCQRVFRDGEGAVGIFGMPRCLWHVICGYNESMTGWGHIEREIAALFVEAGIHWKNLHDIVGCDFYHIWHPTHDMVASSTRPLNDEDKFPLRNQGKNWGCQEHVLSGDIYERTI
jgi:hypothetical protein